MWKRVPPFFARRIFIESFSNNTLLVIAKTEELKEDMKFIGQMVNISFNASLGEYALQLIESNGEEWSGLLAPRWFFMALGRL